MDEYVKKGENASSVDKYCELFFQFLVCVCVLKGRRRGGWLFTHSGKMAAVYFKMALYQYESDQ